MRKDVWRAVIEVGFIIFLFYSNLLMGEFERSGIGQKRGVAWAIGDVFTAANFEIATIAALIGYILFEFLRKRFSANVTLTFDRKRNSNSAPAMMTPVPPRSRSPLTQLTTSPKTCVAMITTASLHPQRRRRNHPIPAVVRDAPSSRKRIPTVSPRAASCLYAVGLRSQRRSRAVPLQSRVVAARPAIMAPKNKKMPTAVNPGVSVPTVMGSLSRIC